MEAAAAGAARARAACRSPASVTDPCDGRTQGTTGMMDSLPYRNDAAIVLRRLIRSLPTRRGVIGVGDLRQGPAGDDDGAGRVARPATVAVPGGVTLPPTDGEDAGAVQTIGARYAHGQLTLEEAAELGCRACASPGGGCQFLGTAATSQVVAEALGLAVPHSALAPSGQPIWLDVARRSARAVGAHDRARPDDARHPHRRGDPQRHGRARGLRRIDEPAAARPRHRARRRARRAPRRRLDRRQPPACRAWWTRCPTARIRPCACSWPAACPR